MSMLTSSTPQLTQPAVLLVPDEIPKLKDGRGFKYVKDGVCYSVNYANGWNQCRAAMLKAGNFREIQNSSTNNCREISETSTNEHGIEMHALLKHIEGMEVSVDVSTCDADAGHRYFGTVTEISELETAKNGFILLVQDSKPNFKKTGNSPAIPDGWIPVSERMPERDYVLAADISGTYYPPHQPNAQVGIYADWFEDGNPSWDDGDGNDLHLKQVTHWTPLPAAPQQEA